MGEEFVEVGGFVETNAKEDTDVDDNAVCILKSESGIIGTLAASWAYTAQSDNSTIIYGEKRFFDWKTIRSIHLIVQYTNGEVVKYELGAFNQMKKVGNIPHMLLTILYQQL